MKLEPAMLDLLDQLTGVPWTFQGLSLRCDEQYVFGIFQLEHPKPLRFETYLYHEIIERQCGWGAGSHREYLRTELQGRMVCVIAQRCLAEQRLFPQPSEEGLGKKMCANEQLNAKITELTPLYWDVAASTTTREVWQRWLSQSK